ncbi:hypothetical protein GGR60_001920 [Xanthomonas arboricola]|nr:hypothetical protein [Xanthomonas euroxanthea]
MSARTLPDSSSESRSGAGASAAIALCPAYSVQPFFHRSARRHGGVQRPLP